MNIHAARYTTSCGKYLTAPVHKYMVYRLSVSLDVYGFSTTNPSRLWHNRILCVSRNYIIIKVRTVIRLTVIEWHHSQPCREQQGSFMANLTVWCTFGLDALAILRPKVRDLHCSLHKSYLSWNHIIPLAKIWWPFLPAALIPDSCSM